MYENRTNIHNKISKFDRLGYNVKRKSTSKIIDCLENYKMIEEVVSEVQKTMDLGTQGFLNIREDIMKRISRRDFGGKLVRMGTPIERTYHGNVQSPSKNKSDIMILPKVTL